MLYTGYSNKNSAAYFKKAHINIVIILHLYMEEILMNVITILKRSLCFILMLAIVATNFSYLALAEEPATPAVQPTGATTPPADGGSSTPAPTTPPADGGNSTPAPTTPPADSGNSTPAPTTPPADSGSSTPAPTTPPADSGSSTPAPTTPPADSGDSTPAPAPAEYNVIYMSAPYGDATAVEILNTKTLNQAIVMSESPNVSVPIGFNMSGWAYENGTSVNFAASQTGDVTLYPVFTKATTTPTTAAAGEVGGLTAGNFNINPLSETPAYEYELDVTFTNIGGESKSKYTVSFDTGDTVIYPAAGATSLVNTENTSYVFAGWKVEGSYNLSNAESFNIADFYNIGEDGKKSVTLTAVYNKPLSDKLVNTYKIKYVDDKGDVIYPATELELPKEGSVSQTIVFPTISGYTLKDPAVLSHTIANTDPVDTIIVEYVKNTDTAYYTINVLLENKADGTYYQDITKTVKGTAQTGALIDYKALSDVAKPKGYSYNKTETANYILTDTNFDSAAHTLKDPLVITIAFSINESNEDAAIETYYAVEHNLLNNKGAVTATHTTYHLVSEGDILSEQDVLGNTLTSFELVSNAGWNSKNTYSVDSSNIKDGYASFADGDALTDEDIKSVFVSPTQINSIATINYKSSSDKYVYTVKYVYEDENGDYIEIPSAPSITRSNNENQYATEYYIDITNYEFKKVLVDGTKVNISSNNLVINAEINKEIMFVYSELQKTAKYTINISYTNADGNEVSKTDTGRAVIGAAFDAADTDFVKELLAGNSDTKNKVFGGRSIINTSTVKLIKADGSTEFNLELSSKAFYYDTYSKNTLLLEEHLTNNKLGSHGSYYSANGGSVTLDASGSDFKWVDENGKKVTGNTRVYKDTNLYAYIEHTVKVLKANGNVRNESVEHGENSTYNVPTTSKDNFSHWLLQKGPSGASVDTTSDVRKLLKNITQPITLEQVDANETDFSKVFSVTTNFTATRYDRYAVEESDINLTVSKLKNGNAYTKYEVEYSTDGGLTWDTTFPTIRNAEDSKAVQYRVTPTNKNYTGEIIGTVQVDVLPINLTINVPSFTTTQGIALSAQQIADANAAIYTELDTQLTALGIKDPSKYTVNFGTIEFAYDASLANTVATHSAALGLQMEKRGSAYNPNAGESTDGTVYTISKTNYNITVNHGDLTVNAVSTSDPTPGTDTTATTPAAAPIAAAAAAPVAADETIIDLTPTPQAAQPEAEQEEAQTTDIEDTQLPTTAMPEEQSATYWPWILVLIVVAGGATFIVTKKMRKKTAEEK